ncbi:MAG: FHA domain-containing protein [Myxococcales bacterium]|nr:FHA domain-containing protein [Myxococcales bacterium]
MSLWRRLFSATYRSARRAEIRGEYRQAAALYAEVGALEEAASALLLEAARAPTAEARIESLLDALRWLPAGHPRRDEADAQVGLAILEDARSRGAHTRGERRRLEEAAERLERVGRDADAAVAWELLGREEKVAAALERGGEVERLEALLEARDEEADLERALRASLDEFDLAMKVGARLEALAAIREASRIALDDPSVRELLRGVEARLPPRGRVRLRIDGRPHVFGEGFPVVLGRDADLIVRGASVSRRHAQIERRGGAIVVRDLGSRNGTRIDGVSIGAEFEVKGEAKLALGDDVEVQLEPLEEAICLRVRSGLDAGLVAIFGAGSLRASGLDAALHFERGHPVLTADPGKELRLGEQRCAAPIALLLEDRIRVEGVGLEVEA